MPPIPRRSASGSTNISCQPNCRSPVSPLRGSGPSPGSCAVVVIGNIMADEPSRFPASSSARGASRLKPLWHSGGDAHLLPAAVAVPADPGVAEAVRAASVSERIGLLRGPAVASQPLGTRPRQPLDGYQPAAGLEDPADLIQSSV